MTLKIPTQTVYGRICSLPDKKTAVIFHPYNIKEHPAPPSFAPLYLRYALTIRGSERPFLPSVVLDDWGQEIGKFKLYRWLHLEGDRFPRAEIFGYVFNFDEQWEENQFFSRDLEHTARHTTYVYADKAQPLASGRPVHHLVMTNSETPQLQPTNGKQFKLPLSRARVKWWHIPADEAVQPQLELANLLIT